MDNMGYLPEDKNIQGEFVFKRVSTLANGGTDMVCHFDWQAWRDGVFDSWLTEKMGESAANIIRRNISARYMEPYYSGLLENGQTFIGPGYTFTIK